MKTSRLFLLASIFLFLGIFTACDDDDSLSNTNEIKLLPYKITVKFENQNSSDLVELYNYDTYNRIIKQEILITEKEQAKEALYINLFEYGSDGISSVYSSKKGAAAFAYKTSYSYGNSIVYIKKDNGSTAATMKINDKGYILDHTANSSIGFGDNVTSYTYDPKGNISEIVIVTTGQNAKTSTYKYNYDDKVGIYKYVNIPQWFLVTYGDMYATTFNPFANNGLKIISDDGTDLIYEAVYEYNGSGYPSVIKIYQSFLNTGTKALYETITLDYILAE